MAKYKMYRRWCYISRNITCVLVFNRININITSYNNGINYHKKTLALIKKKSTKKKKKLFKI